MTAPTFRFLLSDAEQRSQQPPPPLMCPDHPSVKGLVTFDPYGRMAYCAPCALRIYQGQKP